MKTRLVIEHADNFFWAFFEGVPGSTTHVPCREGESAEMLIDTIADGLRFQAAITVHHVGYGVFSAESSARVEEHRE